MVRENLKWERTTNYMCICNVMWLRGKEKKKIPQYSFYGVHTETLLDRRDTKQSRQKENIARVSHLSVNCCLGKTVDKQGEVKRSQPDTSLPNTPNPKSNTGTSLAPNSAKVHITYACFQVHLCSHWDLSYRRGQICCAVLGQGLKHQERTRKFSEEYVWNHCCDWRNSFHPLDFFSNASS